MRNGKKIKLTHANKIILITALGDYYYLQRANNTGYSKWILSQPVKKQFSPVRKSTLQEQP